MQTEQKKIKEKRKTNLNLDEEIKEKKKIRTAQFRWKNRQEKLIQSKYQMRQEETNRTETNQENENQFKEDQVNVATLLIIVLNS